LRVRSTIGYCRTPIRRWALWSLVLASVTPWALAGCGPETAVSAPETAFLPAATASAASTADAGPPTSSTPFAGIPPVPAPGSRPQATFAPETATPKPTEPPLPALIEKPGKPPPVFTVPSIGLELSSPSDRPLEWSESMIISGTASPGATVSVNGVPVLPAADGRFSAALALGSTVDPVSPVLVEVAASNGAGGRAWTVTAALPTRDGVTTLIGTVTNISEDHPRAVAGETDITLMAVDGLVELTATPATVVHIPARFNLGQENQGADDLPFQSIQDVNVGDRAAVSTVGGRVLHLLVLPESPVNSLHFSGVVVPSPASSRGAAFLTLRDRQGNQISATFTPDIEEPLLGAWVTAILSRPSSSEELQITGLDHATASLNRVSAALELSLTAGDTETFDGLLRHLEATAKRRLTLLDDASRWPLPLLAARAREEFAVLQEAYDRTLARYGRGPVFLEVDGIITSLGAQTPEGRKLTVEPESGPLEINLPSRTGVWLNPAETPRQALEGWLIGFAGIEDYTAEYRGSGISPSKLDLGHRVTATYDPTTHVVARIAAPATRQLEDGLARSLLPLAGMGEMAGTVTHLSLQGQARSVYIQDQTTGGTVIFSATTESQTLVDGLPVPLGPDLAGRKVAILFQPGSGEIIEMSTQEPAPGEETVSGVVTSFTSKVFHGNVTILTSQGESKTFTQDQDTVIRRDGRRISVSDVRPGDLVRPNTRHRAEGPAEGPAGPGGPVLTFLSLKSPEPVHLTGTVMGIASPPSSPPGDDNRVTIITDGLDLITLSITESSSLNRLGTEIGRNSLRIGDKISRATYNPITNELVQLELAAPAP
jgi:hypothetical protein